MSKTVLAVDDSQTMRAAIEMTFAGEDYRTIVAANAEEALAKLSENPVVALVDAALGNGTGGGDGYQLCRDLKARAPGLKVVLLSSRFHPFDAARASASGVDEHVDKPFDTQALLDKVGNLPAASVVAATASDTDPARRVTPPPKPVFARAVPRPLDSARRVDPVPPRPVVPVAAAARPALAAAAASAAMPASAAASAAVPAPAAASFPPLRPGPRSEPSPSAPRIETSAINGGAPFADRLAGLGLTADQVQGVLALSREVIEQVVWEIVPDLAETIIREEIKRLTSE